MESGYDVPFSSETDDRFQCPICWLILRDAVQTACGHRFCNACIKKVILSKNTVLTCPVDKTFTKVDQIFPDVATQREILSLSVSCTNLSEGCAWTGELRHLDNHRTTCQMEEVECANGCEAKMRRENLEEHMNQCPHREVECPHCSQQVVHNTLESHTKECPKALTACTACGQDLLREKMDEHTNVSSGQCPMVVVSCPYSYVGCEFKCERYLVEEHISRPDSLHQHMQLALGTIEEQGRTVKELEKKMKTLSDKYEKIYPMLVTVDRYHLQTTDELRNRNVTGRLHWKVKVGGHHRNRATTYSSPAFYTGCPGYKVQLTLNMEGPREGNVRYTTLGLSLLAGDYDSQLVFPFNATCLVTLYDQKSCASQRQHYTNQIVVREMPRNGRRGLFVDRIFKREISKYMKRQDLLSTESRFFRNNALHFEVYVLHSFYPPPDEVQMSECLPNMARGALVLHTPPPTGQRPRLPFFDTPTPGPGTPLLGVATLSIST